MCTHCLGPCRAAVRKVTVHRRVQRSNNVCVFVCGAMLLHRANYVQIASASMLHVTQPRTHTRNISLLASQRCRCARSIYNAKVQHTHTHTSKARITYEHDLALLPGSYTHTAHTHNWSRRPGNACHKTAHSTHAYQSITFITRPHCSIETGGCLPGDHRR